MVLLCVFYDHYRRLLLHQILLETPAVPVSRLLCEFPGESKGFLKGADDPDTAPSIGGKLGLS